VSDDGPSSRPDSAASPAAAITVEAVDPAWLEALPSCLDLCHLATLAVLTKLGFDAFGEALEVGVRLSDDGELRALNQQYRHMDKATNVLSFPASDCVAGALPTPPPAGAPLALGDVVLGLETVRAEATDQGKTLADHLRHLVVHGVLHLAGYDHEDDDDATVMEALETNILAGLGIAEPYGTEPRIMTQNGVR
jgi:probable rRNA maturation factor